MVIETVSVESLTLDPRNARKHPERNLEAIKRSLTRWGQQKPIVVSLDGVVIAGNGTLMAAKALGWSSVDVVRSDMAPEEAKAFAVADNRTAELAAWNWEVLAETGQELIDFGGEDMLADAGFAMDEFEPLLDVQWEPPAKDGTGPSERGHGVKHSIQVDGDMAVLLDKVRSKLELDLKANYSDVLTAACRKVLS